MCFSQANPLVGFAIADP